MSRWYLLCALSALALLLGCRPKAPEAPIEPQDDPSFSQPERVVREGLDDVGVVNVETIRAGDVLAVKVLGNSELDQPKATVDRGGHIHLSLIGDVKVEGLTASEAERVVVEKLRAFDRFSEVSLQVVDTAARTVSVTGAVEKPGNIPLVGDFRLVQVLAEAGGPSMANTGDKLVQLGDVASARLVRNGVVLPIDFQLALEGNPRHNVRVQPGDVVIVPPAVNGRIVVLGNVNKPRTLPFRAGLRLSEALAEAGGLSASADAQDIRILRGGYRKPKLYLANAKLLFEGKRPDPILAQGDIIYVSKHWSATVGEVLDKVVPAVAAAAIVTTLSRE